jgi:hypothetical protein
LITYFSLALGAPEAIWHSFFQCFAYHTYVHEILLKVGYAVYPGWNSPGILFHILDDPRTLLFIYYYPHLRVVCDVSALGMASDRYELDAYVDQHTGQIIHDENDRKRTITYFPDVFSCLNDFLQKCPLVNKLYSSPSLTAHAAVVPEAPPRSGISG